MHRQDSFSMDAVRLMGKWSSEVTSPVYNSGVPARRDFQVSETSFHHI